MGHEHTYRAQQHTRHCPEPGQTTVDHIIYLTSHFNIILSLCLGLTSGLQGTQEISLLEASLLKLYDGIHDTDCQSLSFVYYNCTTG